MALWGKVSVTTPALMSAAVTVCATGTPPEILMLMTSPDAAPVGKVTTTATPSAASAALMPPAASGTVTVGVPGPSVFLLFDFSFFEPALATAATVIASQALITGALSLTMQAVQLGYLPRVAISHTSAEERGQIYIASINWVLTQSVGSRWSKRSRISARMALRCAGLGVGHVPRGRV
jgi:hypothetical protein